MKKIVKLAIIRTEDTCKCPFGLPIIEGCQQAGELITKMAPLSILGEDASEEEKEAVRMANQKLFMWQNPGKRCNYAGKLFKDKEAVECNWGSNAPGIMPGEILGSPFYSKVYNNVALDGIFSYPLGFYGDLNISRNLYYGIYSLLGSETEENIKKLADYLTLLDNSLEFLTPEDKESLKSCAINYANNQALMKKGSNLDNLEKINSILLKWKDLE